MFAASSLVRRRKYISTHLGRLPNAAERRWNSGDDDRSGRGVAMLLNAIKKAPRNAAPKSEAAQQTKSRPPQPPAAQPASKNNEAFGSFFSKMQKKQQEVRPTNPITQEAEPSSISPASMPPKLRSSASAPTLSAVLSGRAPKSQKTAAAGATKNLASFFDQLNRDLGSSETVDPSEIRPANDAEKGNRTTDVSNPNESDVTGRGPTVAQATSTSNQRPISDLFPSRKRRSATAYNEHRYDEYMALMERITQNPQFRGKAKRCGVSEETQDAIVQWLEAEEAAIPTSLPTLEKAVSEGLTKEEMLAAKENLREDLKSQRKAFHDKFGWTEAECEVAIGALIQTGNRCAKTSNAGPLDVAWRKMKEIGYSMNKNMLNNYLFVSSTFSPSLSSSTSRSSTSSILPDKGLHSNILDLLGATRTKGSGSALSSLSPISTLNDEDDRNIDYSSFGNNNMPSSATSSSSIDNSGIRDGGFGDDVPLHSNAAPIDIATETAICQDTLFEPSEQSLSIRVRLLVSQGNPREAEALLDGNRKEGDVLRLRTYAPIFESYLNAGDVLPGMMLYAKMRNSEGVFLQPENYVQLIASLAENGFLKPDAPVIPEIADVGYDVASGPELMDRLAADMAEDVLEISAAAAKRLYNSIQAGFAGEECSKDLQPLHILEPLQVCNAPADPKEVIADRVAVDERTGKCPRSGVQLRLIPLGDQHKRQLRDGLIHLTAEAYGERHKTEPTLAVDSLNEFSTWLDTREGRPFTAIIDGANAAYYMQNYDEGRFNFHQIEFVVNTLEEMGEQVLVVIPERYMQKTFMVHKTTGSFRQVVSTTEDVARQKLLQEGKLYVVPFGMLDDYYWMYASVADQRAACGDESMFVEPDNKEGRWPGIRPMLISNDKMRDHKLSLLEPRLFRRWYSNFIVNFTFSPFIKDVQPKSGIGFTTADFYSREIQGNPSPDSKSTTWHLPVSDWDDGHVFCIRIPRH